MLTVIHGRYVGLLVYEERDGRRWSISTPTEGTSHPLQFDRGMEPSSSSPPAEVHQEIAKLAGTEGWFELVERDIEIGLWKWHFYSSQN